MKAVIGMKILRATFLRCLGRNMGIRMAFLCLLLPFAEVIRQPQPATAQASEQSAVKADELLRDGLLRLNRGDYQGAGKSLEGALERYLETGDQKGAGEVLKNLGNVSYSQGRYEEGMAFQNRALTLARAANDRDLESKCLLNLGSAYMGLGNLEKSKDYYRQCMDLAQKIGNRQVEVKARGGLGRVFYKSGDYPRALRYLEEALPLAQKEGDDGILATLLVYQARIYNAMKDHSKALTSFRAALPLAVKLGNRLGEMAILHAMASIHYDLKDYRQTKEYALAGVQQAESMENREQVFNFLGLLVISSVALGDNAGAVDYGLKRLESARQLNDTKKCSDVMSSLGISYLAQGNYLQAIDVLERLFKIGMDIKDSRITGEALGHLGQVYTVLGEMGKAKESYEKQLELGETFGNDPQVYTALQNLGDIHIQLGAFARAREFYLKSLKVAERLKDKKRCMRAHNRLGNTFHYQKDNVRAIDYARKAVALAEEVGDRWEEWKGLQILGRTYAQLKDPASIEMLQRLVRLSSKLNVRAENIAFAELGSAFFYLGEQEKAIQAFQRSLEQSRETGDPEGEGVALERMGIAFMGAGMLKEAEVAFRDAVKVWESIRAGLGSHDVFKVSIFERQAGTYRTLQKILIDRNQPEAALEIAERGRARAFVELLTRRLTFRPPDMLSWPTIRDIRRIAKIRKATLVEYSVIKEDNKLMIWVVGPDGAVAFREVDMGSLTGASGNPLEALVLSGRRSIGARGLFLKASPSETSQGPIATSEVSVRPLHRLYKLLIEPIQDLLPGDPNAHVVFIPHDVLFLVPFAGLQSPDGRHLVEKHTILTASSLQVLELTRQQSERLKRRGQESGTTEFHPPPALVLGNPTMPSLPGSSQPLPALPGAEEEVRAVASLLGVQPVIGDEATRAKAVAEMTAAGRIHLATHGILDDVRGLGSAVVLAPSGGNMGFLTAEEVMDMQLHADLVVLSACDTGRGRITGDGVIGLSRAFISAGVPSVIVSLWSVPDAPTALLMTEFYKYLRGNPDKAAALRHAMLKTREEHPNPLDWAAFTLIGESK